MLVKGATGVTVQIDEFTCVCPSVVMLPIFVDPCEHLVHNHYRFEKETRVIFVINGYKGMAGRHGTAVITNIRAMLF